MNRHTSIRQIKENNIIAARAKDGLNRNTTEIKEVEKDPSLKYISNPDIKSKTELEKKAKSDNVKRKYYLFFQLVD